MKRWCARLDFHINWAVARLTEKLIHANEWRQLSAPVTNNNFIPFALLESFQFTIQLSGLFKVFSLFSTSSKKENNNPDYRPWNAVIPIEHDREQGEGKFSRSREGKTSRKENLQKNVNFARWNDQKERKTGNAFLIV